MVTEAEAQEKSNFTLKKTVSGNVLTTAAEVQEGDRAALLINPHGSDHPHKVVGTVTEAPRHESTRDILRDGQRAMADFCIEDDDGETFTWNVDNGYVIGYHAGLGRVSDIGRVSALIPIEEEENQ